MNLTDTHIHLYAEDFAEDLPALVAEAEKRGITRFFLPAIDSEYSTAMDQVFEAFPGRVHLMAGLHPTHVKENVDSELEHVKQRLDSIDAVAVGEIGIDLYWDDSYKDAQIYAFEKQMVWASERNLPIVIHCRNAFDEVFESIERIQKQGHLVTGIFHCFTGSLQQAKQAISLGFYLGIGGVVTFKNGKLDTFLSQISLKHIVLETDGPYLAPVPYRGKRNEPGYLRFIADRVADIYSISIEELSKITSSNALRIFKRE
jgi:TatD DNase family protein